jgi:VanZ family protein
MKKLKYFLPAIIFYALIFLVSSRSLGFSIPGHWLDKVPHAIEFGTLGFLLSLGFFHLVSSSPRLSISLTFLTGIGFGALDEFHQKFVRGRSSDPRDALADAVGVAVGIAVYWYFFRKKKMRQGV